MEKEGCAKCLPTTNSRYLRQSMEFQESDIQCLVPVVDGLAEAPEGTWQVGEL